MSSKIDFISWDHDIDLDALLGEYTDENPDPHSPKKKHRKDESDGYKCPECGRVLKTISGFRGHVAKQHGKPELKAYKHRIQKSTQGETTSDSTASDEVHHNLQTYFKVAFDTTLQMVQQDPVHQLFGDSEVRKISGVVMFLSCLYQFFLDTFLGIFSEGTNLCSSQDREQLFHRLHQLRVSDSFKRSYMLLFGPLTFSGKGICDFVNIFMLELIGNVIKGQADNAIKKSTEDHNLISDSDQNILFYICGFIVRSLRKKYSTCDLKRECLDRIILKSTGNSNFISKFNKWVLKSDRGGLISPCDDYFLLIREFERLLRLKVNLDNLSANSLLCYKLKETIMEAFMVKHYSDKLLGEYEHDIRLSVVEDILGTFLTVRGYAITRVERNKLSKLKIPHKKSSGLRQTLRDLSKMDNLDSI